MARLKSVDLELYGIQRTFDYSADPKEVDVEAEDQLSLEIAVGRAILSDVTSLEVQLAKDAAASGRLTIAYHVEYDGEVDVELDDLTEYNIESEDDFRTLVEQGEFYAIQDAIEYDFERNYDISSAVDYCDIQSLELFDENGSDYE